MITYVVHSAMDDEINPLVQLLDSDVRFNKIVLTNRKRCIIYTSENVNIMLYVSDVGILNAAFCINDIINILNLFRFNIRNINFINIGSVGARGIYKIGDILRVGRVYNSDMDLTCFGYDKYEYPRTCKYYDLPGDTICYSMSKFLLNGSMIDSSFDSYIVDMELFGLLYSIKFNNLDWNINSYKVVTDVSDAGLSYYEHINELDKQSEKLCNFVYNNCLNKEDKLYD